MAKMNFEGTMFTHDVTGDGSRVASLDLEAAFPGYEKFPEVLKSALQFAVKTASRNATAGMLSAEKAGYDPDTAFKRVQERFAAWVGGKWAAVAEGGTTGESRVSLLSRAVAEAMGIEVTEAVALINEALQAAYDEAGVDPAEESDKANVRKIGNHIRASLKEDPAVAVIYARLQAEESAKRAEEAASAQAGKASGLKALLKR